MYRVEGYDKDNGVYVEYWKGEDCNCGNGKLKYYKSL